LPKPPLSGRVRFEIGANEKRKKVFLLFLPRLSIIRKKLYERLLSNR